MLGCIVLCCDVLPCAEQHACIDVSAPQPDAILSSRAVPLCLPLLAAQAVEARRKQQERPWVQLLGVMATVSAVLLAVVLWRLQHMPV